VGAALSANVDAPTERRHVGPFRPGGSSGGFGRETIGDAAGLSAGKKQKQQDGAAFFHVDVADMEYFREPRVHFDWPAQTSGQ
jgi:hypothetical protein